MCEFGSSARTVFWYGFFIACDYWVNLPIKLGFPRAHAYWSKNSTKLGSPKFQVARFFGSVCFWGNFDFLMATQQPNDGYLVAQCVLFLFNLRSNWATQQPSQPVFASLIGLLGSHLYIYMPQAYYFLSCFLSVYLCQKQRCFMWAV